MDLQPIIDQLEQQAAQYREAANAMRTLQAQTGGALAEPEQEEAPIAQNAGPARGAGKAKAKTSTKAKAKGGTPKAEGSSGKRTVSPETRAKIAAAIKARHEQRRQQEG